MKTKPFRYLIKLLLAAGGYLLIFLPLTLSAAQVTLQWDWDPNDSLPDGYRLYQSRDPKVFDYSSPVWSGTVTTCTVSGLTAGATYYYVVRAFRGSVESGDSNLVGHTPAAPDEGPGDADADDAGPGVPIPPKDDGAPVSGGGGIGDMDDDYSAGEPTFDSGNTPPAQPELMPIDPYYVSENEVSLTPLLQVGGYYDADGDTHEATCYQISTTDDTALTDFESFVVFERTFTKHLTQLRVPYLVLDPETQYFWRVKFFDSRGGASEWSAWASFTTIDQASAGIDDNGIPDDQQIDQWIVLKGQALEEALAAGLQGVNTSDLLNRQMAVRHLNGNGAVAAVRALDSADLPPAANQPEHLMGVISFKLHLWEDDPRAVVRVYFSRPAPRFARWYKYDPDQGWTVYPHATFSADRLSMDLELEDGGSGDMDGVQNGVIVDPGGLGFSSQTSGSMSYEPVDAARPGCLISLSMDATQNRAVPGIPTALLVAVLGWLAVNVRHLVRARRDAACAE